MNATQIEIDLNTLLSNQYLLGHQLADILFKQQLPTDKIDFSEWYSITRQDKKNLTKDEFRISYENLVFIAKKVKSCHLPVLKQIESTCWFYGAYHALRELVDDIDYIKPLILAMSEQTYQLHEFEHLKENMETPKMSIVAKNILSKIRTSILVYNISGNTINHEDGNHPGVYLLYFFKKCLVQFKCIIIDKELEKDEILEKRFNKDFNSNQVLVLIFLKKQKEKINYTSLCGESFTLKSGIVIYENAQTAHGVAGIFCDGQQYIIDSNTDFLVRHNWCEGLDGTEQIETQLPTLKDFKRSFRNDTFIYVKKPQAKSKNTPSLFVNDFIPDAIRSWFKTPISSDILSSKDFIKTKIAELHWLILKQNNIFLYDVQLCLSIISQTKQTDFEALKQRFKSMLENLPNNDAYLYLGDALTHNEFCIYDILRRLEILIHAIIKAQSATDSVLKCKTSNDNLKTIFCKVHDYASTINKPIAYLFVYGVGTKELTETEKKIIVSYIPDKNVFACVHMFDYQTKGVKDLFNAFKNAKIVQKGKIVNEHPRVNRLIDQIMQLQEFNQYVLVLVGISHGALLLQAALTKIRMGSYSEALLKNTFFYSIGSPRLIPTSILPKASSALLPRVLNYYHENDPVLKLLSALKPFVSRFDFPNLTSKHLAEFHYDKAKALFLYRKSYQNQIIEDYHTGLHLLTPTCHPPILFSTVFHSDRFYALYLYDGYVFFNNKNDYNLLLFIDSKWYVQNEKIKVKELQDSERKTIKIMNHHKMQTLEELSPQTNMLYLHNKVYSLIELNEKSFQTDKSEDIYLLIPNITSILIYKSKPVFQHRSCFLSLSEKLTIKELINTQPVTFVKIYNVTSIYNTSSTIHEFLIGKYFRLFISNMDVDEAQVKSICTNSSNWHFYKAHQWRDLKDIEVNDNDILYDELTDGSTFQLSPEFSELLTKPGNLQSIVNFILELNPKYYIFDEREYSSNVSKYFPIVDSDQIKKDLNVLLQVNQVTDGVIMHQDIRLYDEDLNVKYIFKYVNIEKHKEYSNLKNTFSLYHIYSVNDKLSPLPIYFWIVFPYKQYHAGSKPKRKR